MFRTLLIAFLLLASTATAQELRSLTAPSALPPSTLHITDEFSHAGSTSGTIGQLGWVVRNIGAAPTIANVAGSGSSIGVLSITSTTTQGQGGNVALDGSTGMLEAPIASTPGLIDLYWRAAISATTDVRARLGLVPAGNTAAQPSGLIGFRYDTSSGFADTTWKFCRRSGSDTETCVDTTVSPSTSMARFHIWTTAASPTTFYASIDNSSAVCLTSTLSGCGLTNATIPTVALSPGVLIVTDSAGAASRAMTVDWFGLQIRGLSR